MKAMNHKGQFFLYGAGGHGKVIAEIVEAMGATVEGFFDGVSSGKPNIEVLGYAVYSSMEEMNLPEGVQWLICVGNNEARKRIVQEHPFPFGTAIHPSAVVSPRATLGEGTVVMPGACINSCTVVGRHAIINTNASVDHDCVLADFVHISPGASLAGSVRVGEGTHIGTGASVIPGVTIGKWCTIGAGAVVIRDVPDGVTVVGVPGRGLRSE